MNSVEFGAIVFGCVFGGALFGMFLHTVLPEEHLQSNSTDVLKLATGLVATMAGLVLGMLISSGLTFFNLQKTELLQVCAKVVLIDTLLADYGEDTRPARSELRETVMLTLSRIWPEDHLQRSELKPVRKDTKLYEAMQALSPNNDRQRADKQQAIDVSKQVYETEWLMFIGSEGNSVSGPLLAIVVSWLTTIFISFGLLAQRNATVIVTLIIAAIAVSAAIFIIWELYDPYGGMFQIPATPMLNVLDQIGR
jgi:hypothetical protein